MEFRTPFADLLPGLSSAEFSALEADIRRFGIRQPIEVDEDGNVLDGHNRLRIDPAPSYIVVSGLSFAEKQAHVLRSNSARRNLSPEQVAEVRKRQREVAFRLRDEDPKKWTQAAVAQALGVAQQTVSDWFSITASGNANDSPEKPDARLSIPRARRSEIVERVLGGESNVDVAADFKVTPGRISQIVTMELRRAENEARIDEITRLEVANTFDQLYDVIVIDPPWPMEKIEREVRPNQSAFDYPTMQEEDLAALKLPVRANAHVWVWTTQRFLPMSFRLLDAWHLNYVCTFVWHKSGGFQPVGLPQYNCEFAVYARHGNPAFIDTTNFFTCFDAKRGSHSEKPDEFYDVIRRVTTGERLDMFNRRVIEGFVGWGKESAA